MHRLGHKRQQTFLVFDKVNLVEHQNDVFSFPIQKLQHQFVVAFPSCSVNHEEHSLNIGQRGTNRTIHVLEKLRRVLRLKSRRIDKDDLSVIVSCHAQNTITGRLRFFRGNRNFFANNRIDERGFTDVRTTNNRGITAAVVFLNLFFISHAGRSQHRFKIVIAHCFFFE